MMITITRRVGLMRAPGACVAAFSTLLLSSCFAAPFLIPVAIEFARNLIQTSLSNYGSKHRDNVSNLVNRLTSPYLQNLPPVVGPGMPGYPNQPAVVQQQYPGQQTYPGQSAYPGQQTYPGQTGTYDPNNSYASSGTSQGYGQAQSGYGQQQSPYGTAQPGYGAGGSPSYNPNDPYAGSGANQGYGQSQSGYGQQQSPYGTAQPGYGAGGSPSYDPNNPYGGSGANQGYGQAQSGYGQQSPYGAPQSGYGAGGSPSYDPNNPSGTTAPYGQTSNPYGMTPPSGTQSAPGLAAPSGMPQPYGQKASPYGSTSSSGTQSGSGSANPYAPQQQAFSGTGLTGKQGIQSYIGAASGSKQAYRQAGIFRRGLDAEPVAVDVALVRQRQGGKGKEVVLMNDGEVLKDGGAKKEAGDRFKIVTRTNCDCYLYIVAIDGSGWAEPVYPSKNSKAANPVKKDQEYAFPEAGHWYTLDQVKGIETFYVVASTNRRTDLEESFAQLAAEKRPDAKIVAKVEEPPVVPRGVGSVMPRGIVTVKDETGTSTQVTPLSYAASQPDQDVTVTRWFKHE